MQLDLGFSSSPKDSHQAKGMRVVGFRLKYNKPLITFYFFLFFFFFCNHLLDYIIME